MAAELVETSRLYARINAKIEPEWVEPLAGHLIKLHHSDPHWSKKNGAVMAKEKVTLYGLTLVNERTINFSRIDPALCRELFIRRALVEGISRLATASSAITASCWPRWRRWSTSLSARHPGG